MRSFEPPPSASLRHMLRAGTRAPHDALDRAVGAIADEASYRRYLRGLYAFRAPVEAALERAAVPEGLADWRLVPLAPRLRADLDDLGEPAPRPDDCPETPGPSAAAGMLYVLEGAAIGANLLRVRAARLGFDAGRGARHLARPEEAGRWGAFVARLDAAAGIDPEAALAGAQAAFAGAARAFAGAGAR
ncbi:biliverdin-producing heme oxygenase [Amaricoccus solimangrovi]|nr:biliverdin-producing heme oxygenase [Amaricoccus solimangrovi]